MRVIASDIARVTLNVRHTMRVQTCVSMMVTVFVEMDLCFVRVCISDAAV